ncbi:MAG TPA: PQQ-binding-like beta-propeller repeat protein [Gemmataceae bacterium]
MTRRTARILVGVALVLGVGGFAAYRSSWVRSLFGREAENAAEMARLTDTKLEVFPVSASADWPQWRGPFRDGRAPAGSFRTDWEANPPKRLWSAPCGGGYSSFAVVDGRLYTQDFENGSERILCLDAATGQSLWDYHYPADYSNFKSGYASGPRATPTVVGNRLYAVGAVGKFLCLDMPKESGAPPHLLWEHDLMKEFGAAPPRWGVACSPLIEGEQAIVQPGGKGGSVAAFNRDNGDLKWKAGTNPAGYSSPIAATAGGQRLIYAFAGDALLCIRAADGELLDKYPWTTQYDANIATPIVVDDYVFISSAYSKGCALLRVQPAGDRVKLQEVYARSNRVLRSHHSTAVFRDGFLYGFDGTGRTLPQCVDFRKGTAVPDWGDGARLESGTAILADKHLIVLSENGDLWLIEARPDEFNPVATLRSVVKGSELWALPVLAGGRLYLRGSREIISLDVHGGD